MRGDGRTSGNYPLLSPRKLGATVLLTAILGPLFLQCGQGGRKGPDGPVATLYGYLCYPTLRIATLYG